MVSRSFDSWSARVEPPKGFYILEGGIELVDGDVAYSYVYLCWLPFKHRVFMCSEFKIAARRIDFKYLVQKSKKRL